MPEVSGGQPIGLPGVVAEMILKVPPYVLAEVAAGVVAAGLVADTAGEVVTGAEVVAAVVAGLAVLAAAVVVAAVVTGGVVVADELQPAITTTRTNKNTGSIKNLFIFSSIPKRAL